jgi:hypothetical protein
MNNLAETLRAQKDWIRARKLHEQALDARRESLGAEHPDTTVSAWNLLLSCLDGGNLKAARVVRERDLMWMFSRDPASLAGDQRTVLEMLKKMLGK